MPDRCVVFGCSNESDLTKGISLHRIPFWNDDRAEAKRRRKVWVNFVAKKRDKWKPTKYSAVCSAHFNSDDYEIYAIEIPGTKDYTPRLKKDDIGVMVFPTIYKICDDPVQPSPRDKRQVRVIIQCLTLFREESVIYHAFLVRIYVLIFIYLF